MKRVGESGHSLFGTVGALIAFVGCCILLFYWSSIWLHNLRMEKITETTSHFFQKYQEALPNIFAQRTNLGGPLYIQSYELLETCEAENSKLDPNKSICLQPLGELDFEVQYDAPYMFTFFYLHFTDMYKRRSCRDFLSIGWQNYLPSALWGRFGYLGVVSEKGTRIYFSLNDDYVKNDGAQKNPTKKHMKDVCRICKDSRYCSILFFLSADDGVVQHTAKGG